MSTRARMRRDRRIRICLWGTVLLVGIVLYLCAHPIIWHSEDRLAAGTTITLEASADFLIVVDYDLFENTPRRFTDMEFSLAWLNTLQQEIGPVSLLDAQGFADASLDKYRCIILTHSASAHDAWVPKLKNYLERGGTLVLEMPSGALRTIASADGKGGMRNVQNVTYASGLPDEFQKMLSTLDLANRTQIIGSAAPLEDSTTYLMIDGIPAIYAKEYATGHVITLDFNYGMLLTSLQQGRPLDDFSLRNYHDSSAFETSDLAVTDNIPYDTPLADLLERFLLYGVLDHYLPVVGLWPYFDGQMGTLLVTHQEHGMGDNAAWMPAYESTFKATSTMFVATPPSLTQAGLETFRQFHTEIGLSFDLTSSLKAVEPIGPIAFSPVWRRLTLSEQTDALKKTLGDDHPLFSAQSHDGYWHKHYTHTFRMLAAADFKADASYRAPSDKPGYAFMTGMPFMPLDINGKLFNIMEFPMAFPKMENPAEAEYLQKLLEKSAASDHACIGIIFEPDFFIRKPSLDTFRIWKTIYRTASDNRHWVTGIMPYLRFTRARFNAELTSRVTSTRSPNKRGRVLRLESLAPESGMMVMVPATLNDSRFSQARRGIHRVREDALLADTLTPVPVSVFGMERMLVPLAKGFNAIDIVYE